MENFLKISEAANMGVHALAYLATSNGDESVSATEIAEVLQVSESHLAKVLQRLAKQKLITSSRGAKGGFLLTKPPETISALEIIEALDGPLPNNACFLGKSICKPGRCVLKTLLYEVRGIVKNHLEKTKLSDFEISPKKQHASSLQRKEK